MKKKQLFAGALAAAMMTASLAGCGGAASSAATSTTGGDTAGSTASADTNSGVVEVTIPSYKTGENAGAAFFVPQVERFNEKYAGKYKINLESVPQDSIFNDRLKQLAQQNKLPVLVEGGDPDWVKNVVIPNGLAYDLTDWIDASVSPWIRVRCKATCAHWICTPAKQRAPCSGKALPGQRWN